MNILQAIHDENLFRPFLADPDSWSNWQVALSALYGLPIKAKADRELVRQCTGRDPVKLPRSGFGRALFLTGRRSGKSRTAAIIGAFEAALGGHESKLAPGERGVVVIASPTRNQSRIVTDYVRAVFTTPMLKAEVVSETRDGFELRSGTRIEILAGDWRTVRGYTLLAAIVDEVCFFGLDGESKIKSDTELVRALEPSLATTQGRLIAISSPYARRGWSFSTYKKCFGNDAGRTLVWNCPSKTMNPTLRQSIIDAALAEDLASAKAEYLGEFRDDIATFLSREVIEACVVPGRVELLPDPRRNNYCAFCDISGGRVDDAALAIGHVDSNKVVVDFVRAWKPPFSPDAVIGEMVAELGRFGIDECVGDSYSAEFVKSSFESRGIRYRRSTTNVWADDVRAMTAKPRSQLYLELLPRLCSQEIELLDNEALISQLASLERRTRVGGRDLIDHPPGGHDDLANAVAGVADVCSQRVVVAGAVCFGDSDIDRSPLQRTLDRLEAERLDRLREERALCGGDEAQEPWFNLMRKVGRI